MINSVLHSHLSNVHGFICKFQNLSLVSSQIAISRLCVVCRGGHISSPSSPVDVDVLALWVFLACVFGLDPESVGAEVVTLSLQQVGGEVLGAVTVEERQGRGERRGWDAPECSLGDDISPSGLRVVDSLLEEVVEQQVLKIRVGAVTDRDQ